MNTLNDIKLSVSDSMETDWLGLSSNLASFSFALRHDLQSQIVHQMMHVLHHTLQIAKINDINMHNAWNNWHKKARNKIYLSS